MLTLNNKEVIAVEVPEEAYNIEVDGNCFSYMANYGFQYESFSPLPPGNWELLGRADEITEEQAREVFGIIPFNGKFLEHLPHGMMRAASFSAAFVLDTALESFQSWCRKEEITNEVLIIKK